MKAERARARSMLWRMGALALAVTVVSLALHLAVITLGLLSQTDQLVAHLAARATLTRALLQATPADARDALAAQLRDDEYRLERGAAPAGAGAPMPEPIGTRLAQRLGPDFSVQQRVEPGVSFGPRVVWMAFVVDGQAWRAELRAQPPLAALLGTAVGWLLLAAAAVAASLLVGMRFIVQPLRQITDRIAGQAGAITTLAAPPGASAEVLLLVERFNRLAERVQSADRSKQQLLAGVSHDLRTPLARLRLRIETQCAPDVAEAAEDELRAVEHIVAQFLAYVHGDTRVAQGPPTSMLATVRGLLSAYEAQGKAVHLQAEAPDMALDGLAVQRALGNLVDNALAHGSTPVVVGWTAPTPTTRELAVWDRGPGLSEAQFQQALEPFVRLSSTAGIGHCGLGLAIVAQIVQQWQGQLSCRTDTAGRFGVVISLPAAVPAKTHALA